MLYYISLPLLVYGLSLSTASMNIRPAGWLDRLVEYHRQNFIKDLQKLPIVQIKAKLDEAPPGYVDSKDWDYESVMHLLMLIRQSEGLGPVRRAIRQALQTSRRRMKDPNIYKFNKYLRNGFELNIEPEHVGDVSSEYNVADNNNGVIIVSNPVEARLPSAMISINLLREILENRALAARYLPTTKKTLFTWKPLNKTKSSEGTTCGTPVGLTEQLADTAQTSPAEAAGDSAGTGAGGEVGSTDAVVATTVPAA